MNINKNTKIHIFAFAAMGKGISGSDRIFIELSRQWAKKNSVNVYVTQEGLEMCKRQNLSSPYVSFCVSQLKFLRKSGFFLSYIVRILNAIFKGFSIKIRNPKNEVIYSASDFWMDALPGFILKLRYQKIVWVATWFQTAPNPIHGFAEGKRKRRYRLSAFLYWMSQLPVKVMIKIFADYVLVNNDSEKKHFSGLNKKNRVIVLIGAIDLEKIKKWIRVHGRFEKKYDAVFQGRFHPQKGVIELIEIWKIVVKRKPHAQLVMIGDGPLMNDVKSKIKELKLTRNITVVGYLFDGDRKYQIFSESRIVVHPALYDSGGMASAEAMAFGLPCIGFDLKAYESYYPKGMIKTQIGDFYEFAQKIVDLLDDKGKYKKLRLQAIELVEDNWTWEDRAKMLLDRMNR